MITVEMFLLDWHTFSGSRCYGTLFVSHAHYICISYELKLNWFFFVYFQCKDAKTPCCWESSLANGACSLRNFVMFFARWIPMCTILWCTPNRTRHPLHRKSSRNDKCLRIKSTCWIIKRLGSGSTPSIKLYLYVLLYTAKYISFIE